MLYSKIAILVTKDSAMWLSTLFFIGTCLTGPIGLVAINVTATAMTSVVHPDVLLDWSTWNPCATAAVRIPSTSLFFKSHNFDTGMILQVGNATPTQTLCARHGNVDRLKTIVDERYRYQFTVNDLPVVQTQHYPSAGITIRTRGVTVASLDFPVTNLKGKLKERSVVSPLSHLHFILSGKCDSEPVLVESMCEIGRVDVVPTYAHSTIITYDSEWKTVNDVVFDRMDDIMTRDDETSHAAIMGIVVCGTFIVIAALSVMLGVRRRLVPFLKKGSTIWAECGWWTWRSLQSRMLESEIELGTMDELLVTTEDDEMLAEYDANAHWREYSGDVSRTPRRVKWISFIVAAGMHTTVFIACILCPVLWRVRYTRLLLLYTFWTSTAVASFVASVIWVKVGVALRADTPQSFRGAATASFFLPTAITICGLFTRGVNTINVLLGTCVWAVVCCGCCTLGISVGSAITSMPKLRVNKVPRPNTPLDGVAKSVAMISPALAYTGVSIPILVVMQQNWGSHAVAAVGLVYATGVLGLLLVACSAVLLVFLMLCRGSYKWNWTVIGMGASVGIYTSIGCTLMWMHLPTQGVTTGLHFAFMQAIMSIGVALICASIAWLSAHTFIISIYTNCKYD